MVFQLTCKEVRVLGREMQKKNLAKRKLSKEQKIIQQNKKKFRLTNLGLQTKYLQR